MANGSTVISLRLITSTVSDFEFIERNSQNPVGSNPTYWLRLIGLVQRLAVEGHCAEFVTWTGWTLAMAVSWWHQHLEHWQCYYYFFFIIIIFFYIIIIIIKLLLLLLGASSDSQDWSPWLNVSADLKAV